ncbi:hypothetical protein C8Q77DRAFT_137450 [Trametes polyzona]|nr:hypothetical protein C8Q77DRAFT_137450 [Trametes polyzona]
MFSRSSLGSMPAAYRHLVTIVCHGARPRNPSATPMCSIACMSRRGRMLYPLMTPERLRGGITDACPRNSCTRHTWHLQSRSCMDTGVCSSAPITSCHNESLVRKTSSNLPGDAHRRPLLPSATSSPLSSSRRTTADCTPAPHCRVASRGLSPTALFPVSFRNGGWFGELPVATTAPPYLRSLLRARRSCYYVARSSLKSRFFRRATYLLRVSIPHSAFRSLPGRPVTAYPRTCVGAYVVDG